MDQTISEVVYRGRIKDSLEKLKSGNNVGGGTIVASDGNTYKKVDGRLVQVISDPRLKRNVKFLEKKLSRDGLLSAKASEAMEASAVASSEVVATM